jgi:C4-dicarboxylate-specific signal transduction histidine kinase
MKALAHQGDEEPFLQSNVRDMVTDALELCTQRFHNNGIRLISPVIDGKMTLECRNHQIVQVLINLLNNAFDAVSELSDRWVELEISDAGDFIRFQVTDSGKGITNETQIKLFEPFFSTKRVQYGTGLGLSISRSIVAGHEGRLFYDRESANTRFIMELPKKQPKPSK